MGNEINFFYLYAFCDYQGRKKDEEKNRHKEKMAQIKYVGMNQSIDPTLANNLKNQYGLQSYNYVVNTLIESSTSEQIVWQNPQQEAIFNALCEGNTQFLNQLRGYDD